MTDRLAPFAGHDPSERPWGVKRGPHTPVTLAIMASQVSIARVQRMKAQAGWAHPATGGFPYTHANLVEAESALRQARIADLKLSLSRHWNAQHRRECCS